MGNINLDRIFYFLGGKIVSQASSKNTGSPELYKKWEFPEEYKHFNHPTWKKPKLDEDWNFIHAVCGNINEIYNRADRELSLKLREAEFEIYNFKLLSPSRNSILSAIDEFITWYNEEIC